jgi:hypothetical protein
MKTKNKSKNDLEKIDDFTLATTLICLGYEPLLIESGKINPQMYEFIFDKTEAVERLVRAYFNRNLLVEPNKFLKSRKEIHDRIKKLESETL